MPTVLTEKPLLFSSSVWRSVLVVAAVVTTKSAPCAQCQRIGRGQFARAHGDVVLRREAHVIAADAAADGLHRGAVVGLCGTAFFEGAARFAVGCHV